MAAVDRMAVFVRRVDTHDNIADLPSRRDFQVLEASGARFIAPQLDPRFESKEAWIILQKRWASLS